MAISDRLKELRSSAGLSQRELAEATGINFSTIQKYEGVSNVVKPSIDNLLLLSHFYHVSIDYILENENYYELESLSAKAKREEVLRLASRIVEITNK